MPGQFEYEKEGELHEIAAQAVGAVIASQAPPFTATLEIDSQDNAWKAVIRIEVKENK